MKLVKALCCMFLFAFFGLDPAQFLHIEKLTNTNMLVIRNSCIVNERETKDCAGCGPSNINLGLFICSCNVCQASEPVPSINYYTFHR